MHGRLPAIHNGRVSESAAEKNFGTYNSPMPRHKMQVPASGLRLPTNPSCGIYSELIGTEHVNKMENPSFEKLRRKPKKLDGLVRYKLKIPKNWVVPRGVSCSAGLYVYTLALHRCGQRIVAKNLTWFLGIIRHRWNKYKYQFKEDVQHLYIDDFYRHHLKELSAYAYPKCFSKDGGPAYMLISQLHSLTGRAPFTKQQIIDDITQWVSDHFSDGRLKHLDQKTMEYTFDHVFSNWYRGEAEGFLNFKSYCNDFLRWGTSGGAPKTQFLGSVYRTKWAWALKHSTDPTTGRLHKDRDLYKTICRQADNTCHIALKEEAQKTREVITTPMHSYVRQSYLLYRWGKPSVPSPISNNYWLPTFEERTPKWYGCIDGERFDHSVPASVVYEFLRRLGNLDDECRAVAQEEIACIQNLVLKWGEHEWKYKGGLLSGWRMTSILGSIISMAASFHVSKLYSLNTMEPGVMGDDLVLTSDVETLTSEQLVDGYNDFGLTANLTKTVSGKVGEFLRKVRSESGSWAYPALGLKTLMYANPWIDNYTYEREEEVAKGWMTFASRLIPHTTNPNMHADIKMHCIRNLEQLYGKRDWNSWLSTPMSAGGGGCTEWQDENIRWCTLIRDQEIGTIPTRLKLPVILGAAKRVIVQTRQPKIAFIDIDKAHTLKDSVAQYTSIGKPSAIIFKHSTNMTSVIYSILYDGLRPKQINYFITRKLPLGMRNASRTRLIEFLLMGQESFSFSTTIVQTPDSISYFSSLQRFMMEQLVANKKNVNIKNYRPTLTLLYNEIYRNTFRAFGTW